MLINLLKINTILNLRYQNFMITLRSVKNCNSLVYLKQGVQNVLKYTLFYKVFKTLLFFCFFVKQFRLNYCLFYFCFNLESGKLIKKKNEILYKHKQQKLKQLTFKEVTSHYVKALNFFKITPASFDSRINSFFLFIYLQKFINTNIYLNFSVCNLCINNKSFIYRKYFKSIKKISKFFLNLKLLDRVLDVIVLTLYKNDLDFLKNFIIFIIENSSLKSHKKFFSIFKQLFCSVFTNLKHFGFFGFLFRISGKIGSGGSTKKRQLFFKKGNFSLTRKNQKVSFKKFSLRTFSGVLGCNLLLSYN